MTDVVYLASSAICRIEQRICEVKAHRNQLNCLLSRLKVVLADLMNQLAQSNRQTETDTSLLTTLTALLGICGDILCFAPEVSVEVSLDFESKILLGIQAKSDHSRISDLSSHLASIELGNFVENEQRNPEISHQLLFAYQADLRQLQIDFHSNRDIFNATTTLLAEIDLNFIKILSATPHLNLSPSQLKFRQTMLSNLQLPSPDTSNNLIQVDDTCPLVLARLKGHIVSVKMFSCNSEAPTDSQTITAENHIILSNVIIDPSIMHSYGFYMGSCKQMMILSEYANSGSLRSFMTTTDASTSSLLLMLLDSLRGLVRYHEFGLIHGNVSYDCIFIFDNLHAKLSILECLDKTATFASPESVCGKPKSLKSDVFSYGMTVIQTLVNGDLNMSQSNEKLIQFALQAVPQSICGLLSELLMSCLMFDVDGRCSSSEALLLLTDLIRIGYGVDDRRVAQGPVVIELDLTSKTLLRKDDSNMGANSSPDLDSSDLKNDEVICSSISTSPIAQLSRASSFFGSEVSLVINRPPCCDDDITSSLLNNDDNNTCYDDDGFEIVLLEEDDDVSPSKRTDDLDFDLSLLDKNSKNSSYLSLTIESFEVAQKSPIMRDKLSFFASQYVLDNDDDGIESKLNNLEESLNRSLCDTRNSVISLPTRASSTISVQESKCDYSSSSSSSSVRYTAAVDVSCLTAFSNFFLFRRRNRVVLENTDL